MADSPYTVQWAAPLPLEIAPLYGGFGPQSNNGSLGPSESIIQTVSRSIQLFCRAHECNRPTYHVTQSVTICLIYVVL